MVPERTFPKACEIPDSDQILDIVHKLQDGKASIGTIVNSLSSAGFPEKMRGAIEIVLKSEEGKDHQKPIEYQQQLLYPSYPNP